MSITAPIDLSIFDNMSDEEVQEYLKSLRSTVSKVAKERNIKVPANRSAAAPKVGGIAPLRARSNELARALNAHSKTTARVEETQTGYDAAVAEYLEANKLTELPAELVTSLEEAASATVARANAAHDKVRSKMKGVNTQALHAERTTGSEEAADLGEDVSEDDEAADEE